MTAPPASEMSEYAFKPFRLTQVNYKRYDGLFDRGIKMYPRPRSGHRIVCNDSDIFCFGGFNPATRSGSHMLFQEFWRFNTFTRKWTLVFGPRDHVSLPAELASHSMCMHGDIVVVSDVVCCRNTLSSFGRTPDGQGAAGVAGHNIHSICLHHHKQKRSQYYPRVQIFGGTGFPFGTSCSNRVYIIHPYRQPKATITELETIGDVPPPQYGQSILVHDNHLYVVGGTTGFDYTCDIHRLNFKTLVWECVSECRAENEQDPLGRYRHEVVTDADNIYVIGGGTSSTTYPLEHVPTFSLRTGKWRNLETLPDPSAPAPGIPMARKCHSCVHQTNSDGDVSAYVSCISGVYLWHIARTNH